ncbi:MAG TPA: hypothetical protein VF023_11910, partial [Bryobacteraceae bacterium]
KELAGRPLISEGIIQRALAAGIAIRVDADRLAGIVLLIRGAAVYRKSRHDLDVLSGIASDLDIILQLLGAERSGLFAGINWRK